MKTIKTNVIIKDFKGNMVKDNEGIDWTLGTVITQVLSGKVSNPSLGYQLAKKFAIEDEVNLTAEDIVFIKKELENNGKAMGYGFNAIVIGQCIELLEAN